MKKWFVILFIAVVLISGCTQSPQVSEQHKDEQLNGLPCSGEECRSFCMQNPDTCGKFCEQNPTAEICSHRPDEAPPDQMDFYSMPNQMEDEQISLSIPFDIENYRYSIYGIWPFCVHGGDHPEGHGGIDFELAPNTKIYASADGVVEYIEPKDIAPHGWGDGVHITSEPYVVGYVCLNNITVKVGDEVKKGQFLGYACKAEKGYFIHYEIGDVRIQKRVCPTEYMDSEFREAMNEMFSKAHYEEQSQEPDICNCDGVYLPGSAN